MQDHRSIIERLCIGGYTPHQALVQYTASRSSAHELTEASMKFALGILKKEWKLKSNLPQWQNISLAASEAMDYGNQLKKPGCEVSVAHITKVTRAVDASLAWIKAHALKCPNTNEYNMNILVDTLERWSQSYSEANM